jgi:hypothetical protein
MTLFIDLSNFAARVNRQSSPAAVCCKPLSCSQEEEISMFANLVHQIKQAIQSGVVALRKGIAASTKPRNTSLVRGSLQDLVRTKPQLIAENALLRQQLIVLNRSVKRPCLTGVDRSLLVLLASRVRTWKDALLIVKPDTLLHWHRQGFRLFW